MTQDVMAHRAVEPSRNGGRDLPLGVLAPEGEEDVLNDLARRLTTTHLMIGEAPEPVVVLPEDALECRLVAGPDERNELCVVGRLNAGLELQGGFGCHGSSGESLHFRCG